MFQLAKQKLVDRRVIAFCCLFLFGELDLVCLAEDSADSLAIASTHLERVKPDAVKDTNELLVSLEQYLGEMNSENSQTKELKLNSAGRPLILEDSKGVVHKSSQIKIGWRKISLKSPKIFRRKVIGPFASFESAQRISLLLKEDGVPNFIARPSDWEIWVSQSTHLPQGLKFKLIEEKFISELTPVLKLGFGEYPLSKKVFIRAPDGLIWRGGIYQGPFLLKPDAYGTWTFIEKIPIEKYLLGVLPHEIGASSPPAALAAQAVLARTWALANSKRFEIDGYHLCSDTQCQVYKNPEKANKAVALAISDTSGKVLKWNGKPINAVYHATNGGISAAGHEAWSMSAVPYLRTFLDGSSRWKKQFSLPIQNDYQVKRLLSARDGAYGNGHRLFRWKRTLTAEQIKYKLNFAENETPISIEVLERGPSGRALALEIKADQETSSVVLRLDAIRKNLNVLPSTLFFVEKVEEGVWEFSGGGFGHGAGLSQAGAIDLALRGWNARKILKYYYPGTTYESFK